MSTRDILLEKLHKELKNNLSFWLKNVVNSNTNNIFPEVSIHEIPNNLAPLGAMYVSRVLYGASAAFKIIESNTYVELADISFKKLQEFRNPKGGYYWSKSTSNTFLHDAENVNMAQAFVLYGLVAYAGIKNSKEVDTVIDNHVNFIKKTLYDTKNGGYIDGFDENWNLAEVPTKALGTHLHLLEAFVKLYEYKKDDNLVPIIKELISIILDYFITKDTYDCLHRLTPEWEPLPNEVWAGHNAECSWILCSAAEAIRNENLKDICNKLALKTMQQVLFKAIDNNNGGVFNVLRNGKPTEKVKIWWPQAETIIALLNCLKITEDPKYFTKATELMDYLSANFIASNGEWYTEIWNTGEPNISLPMVHFWKSMYHTVRYYAEVNERIINLNL